MGCSLASSLVDLKKKLKRDLNPDLLFIEPSEMVVTQELLDVTAMGLRDIRYDIGPFITLVDGPQFGFLWTERQSLLLGQMHKADLVAVSRIDLIEHDELADINHTLKDYCPRLIALSTTNGSGIKEVVKQIH